MATELLTVGGYDGLGPLDHVFDPSSMRLAMNPELKVLRSVVPADTILVMDLLLGEKLSPNSSLHHPPVLELPFPVVHEADVAVLVDGPATPLPVWSAPRRVSMAPPSPMVLVAHAPDPRWLLATIDLAETSSHVGIVD